MDFSYASAPICFANERKIPCINDTSQKQVTDILSSYKVHLDHRTNHHLGYPYNLSFNYDALKDLAEYSINNLGDPFIESNYGVHSRSFEIAVLDWFASLWDINREDYWGYITSSGTEGNLHGIYVGRENYPNGILYASADSHYSVFKAARMYRMDCEKVASNPDGTIDLADLAKRLQKNKGRPAIINVNIGTTLKGGVDDLDGVIATLYKNEYHDNDFYIHCDGALVGIMIAFLEDQYLSFAKKPIGSISVSGHKFIGSPVPCGVIITRLDSIKAISQNIDYINSRDATIMGSRNGHAPLYMWYTLVQKGKSGVAANIKQCIENAQYLEAELRKHGIKNVLLNKWSNTVVFEAPKDQNIIRKWQLATSNNLCHIVVMQNIDKCKLDTFVREITQ